MRVLWNELGLWVAALAWSSVMVLLLTLALVVLAAGVNALA